VALRARPRDLARRSGRAFSQGFPRPDHGLASLAGELPVVTRTSSAPSSMLLHMTKGGVTLLGDDHMIRRLG
jgi:hypothetical protein